MTNYILNVTTFAKFNPSGTLDFYRLFGTRYAYEIPCDSFSGHRYFYDPNTKASFDLDFNSCMYLHHHLFWNADFYAHPSYNLMYEGSYGYFCYSHDYTLYFPQKQDTPDEYSSYKIKADKFYVNTPKGRVFKSPSVADYKRFVSKNLGYVDLLGDPNFDEYLYDYWE